jgi:ubiquitin carboxyl-terminal hydrolase 14
MLMGTAEAVPVEPPKELPKFVEDLPESEQEHLETKRFGAGLHNLGNVGQPTNDSAATGAFPQLLTALTAALNPTDATRLSPPRRGARPRAPQTCYMNSTLQCMYAVQPLRQALLAKPGAAGADSTARLVAATAELFKDMEAGGAPFPPYGFLMALRAKFPQFAQTGEGGVFAQQDAEECWCAAGARGPHSRCAEAGQRHGSCTAQPAALPCPPLTAAAQDERHVRAQGEGQGALSLMAFAAAATQHGPAR